MASTTCIKNINEVTTATEIASFFVFLYESHFLLDNFYIKYYLKNL